MESQYGGEVQELTWGWWLLVLVGVLSVSAGVVILFKPGDTLPRWP
jgi:uncharacterized membrane protein HdeD (DUF308 family)